MSSLAHILSGVVAAAFEAEGLSTAFGVVRVSDRPDLAQFQCNGALAAAKSAGKNPREVAQAIVVRLKENQDFSRIEIAGPGFINLDITDETLSRYLSETAGDGRWGVPTIISGETIVLDYGGPNIAKPMHVGHLRASIIGDSLRRICLFAGYRTLGDVHLGDWGLPMGQILAELETRYPEWPYFDDAYRGPYPAESPVTMDDLEEIYPAASQACKLDEGRMERARLATRDLQNGRAGYRALWEHFINVSVAGMQANFRALGVHFDLWKGEASVHELIAPMIEDLREKGLARESDGALVVEVGEESDKKEFPPLILTKRDGAVMYGTTDLATIVERVRDYNPFRIIYVVDQRQFLHFEQVFRAARLGGIVSNPETLVHAGFGTMNGPDGKPFKTRVGGVMKLEDLITGGIDKALARLNEAELAADMDEKERQEVARKVAVAALKFADLQNNRLSDYIFDLDRMTSFEGKTGPYLLYQAVRIQSLLRKADLPEGGNSALRDPQKAGISLSSADRPLALLLAEFPDHFDAALRNYTPHILCDYAFRLAQEFSSFYGNCHILSEKNNDVRAGRLALCELTLGRLLLVLDLLGIEIPARM
ncbi:MAG: arginine--tRNA ligase [Alphaproteobacteria bacterium]|nr:arginine--tRNA ligase [Alphaproteobacteria bacterium]